MPDLKNCKYIVNHDVKIIGFTKEINYFKQFFWNPVCFSTQDRNPVWFSTQDRNPAWSSTQDRYPVWSSTRERNPVLSSTHDSNPVWSYTRDRNNFVILLVQPAFKETYNFYH